MAAVDNHPLHIGIVACSAEGAALCYRTIVTEAVHLLGPHTHPEISMHTPSFADYVAFIDRGDWKGVGSLMLGSANLLAKVGADFVICPDNTIHQALPYIKDALPVPWLHIAEVVAERAREHGYARIGITGTRWLVESDVYPVALQKHGLSFLRPGPEEREEISRIIMEELVLGVFKPEAVEFFQRTITRLKADGCDAVALACTEIPLIINDENSALPTLDSTRLLARAALKKAVNR